uniref:Uncharacterized protein n=1 Tax=Trichogramma kaykai TaxID=54128 RepID=A0ABD2XKE5_9HYME
MSESLLVDSVDVDETVLLHLPAVLKKSLEPMADYFKDKKQLLHEQLLNANVTLYSLSEDKRVDLKDIHKKIIYYQKALKNEKNKGETLDSVSVDRMNSLRNEIKELCL